MLIESLSLKKEWNSDTCYNIEDLEDIMQSEIRQRQRTNTVTAWFYLWDRFTETESRMVVARGWGIGSGVLLGTDEVMTVQPATQVYT
jgi:hypothetical protein